MKREKKDRYLIRYQGSWLVEMGNPGLRIANIARKKNTVKRIQIMEAKQRAGCRRKRAADFFYERSLRTTASPTDSPLPAVINVRKTDAMSDYE